MPTNNGWNSQDPAQVAMGGTGATTLTGVLTGNGTSAVTANTVNQYGTVIAGISNAVSSVAPSATVGIPYVSQGAAANPIFGTAVVAGGGTGVATMTTAYAPVCAGTTATGALQVASTGLSTSGYVLTSNGAAALPSFQLNLGIKSVVIQSFTSSGTYTPSARMVYCIAECQGGGGGGGGAQATGATTNSVGAGGGAGGYSRNVFSSATIGASQVVTINTGGAGGIGAAVGSVGGNVALGALLTASGGSGGNYGGAVTLSYAYGGGGGVGGGGVNITGGTGGSAWALVASYAIPGFGANSLYGNGGIQQIAVAGVSRTGVSATGYGAGGGGAANGTSVAAATGGAGANGIIIITEYCN